jgi:hypothetical protein
MRMRRREWTKVGYLPSYDRTLERALAALGVDAKKLTVDDIAKSDLSSLQHDHHRQSWLPGASGSDSGELLGC